MREMVTSRASSHSSGTLRLKLRGGEAGIILYFGGRFCRWEPEGLAEWCGGGTMPSMTWNDAAWGGLGVGKGRMGASTGGS